MRQFYFFHGHEHDHHHGDVGRCVCLNCGYRQRHEFGVPCRTMVCPTCNLPLRRQKDDSASTLHESDILPHSETIQRKKYPFVIVSKCVGCERCLAICPRDAIVMREGKAFVITEKCSGCRICMRACPVNAFELR